MNIDDVETKEIEEVPTNKVFARILQMQHACAVKYAPLERRNGFWYPDGTEHVDDGQLQNWIKNMFWRVTEEVAEAFEEIPDLSPGWKSRWDQDTVLRHFWEELADALHFLAEATLTIDPSLDVDNLWSNTRLIYEVPQFGGEGQLMIHSMNFITKLGLTANCLKIKPWKTTHMQTDQAKFKGCLRAAWIAFFTIWQCLECTPQDVFVLYAKKNTVNHFRIRSNY